jgi:hypothetical protein
MFFENEFATIDKANYPLVKVCYLKNDPSAEEFQEYLEGLNAVSQQPHIRVMNFDDNFLYVENKIVKMQAKWLETNAEVLRRNCLACAFYVASLHTKQIVNRVFALQEPPYPFAVFGNIQEAERWALAHWPAEMS